VVVHLGPLGNNYATSALHIYVQCAEQKHFFTCNFHHRVLSFAIGAVNAMLAALYPANNHVL
jgi:hypothetical protein